MNEYKTLQSKLILCSKGAAMGVADIIPGVSGGTIAFISGIYEHLVAAISSVRFCHALSAAKLLAFCWHRELRTSALRELSQIHWNFLLPLLTGIGTAILVMARIIPQLMKDYPLYMYSLFFGLIACSIPIIACQMEKNLKSVSLLLISALLMFLLMGDAGTLEGSTSLLYVFISGAIAICAMILPGISGSYILVLMGQYLIVLDALKNKDLAIISVFILGIIVGIISFTRLLKFLLSNHHSATIAALTGIMLGSLRAIWPGKYVPETGVSTMSIVICGVIMILGGLTLFLLNKASRSLHDPAPPLAS
jgi:putative membrane protein